MNVPKNGAKASAPPIKAIVMAGGEGSRLRPLTVGRPKPMVPVVNKSVLAHMFDLLKSHEITQVVVTLRYMAYAIQDFFEDGSSIGIDLRYSIEESPLGTAGSVKNASGFIDDTFLVISGDAVTDYDLSEIIASHRASGAAATIALARVANPLEYGVIITDEDNFIVQFLEKPSWGEVISDTVNTGIYILEPEVLDLIPPDTPFDFSQQLFPKMLSLDMKIHGYVADGYWCDVGNIEEYHRANADMLHGNIQLAQPIGEHIGGGVWVGKGVEIAPSAQLFGPIYLGDEVKIKGDVVINGPTVVRDYSVVDNHTRIERTVAWRNNYIGESCELRGVIVGRQCSIKSKVVAFEGVVIGDNCVLGEGSALHANVKLWPRKEVDPGARVNDSIIWGNQARRGLFNRHGVSGVVNVDLTPEFAAKLSAALGAILDKDSFVAVNRDTHRSSRMLKRALVSGLPGTGINVLDTATSALPVVRHYVRNNPNISAGIHVRISPYDQRVVDIRFMDAEGIALDTSTERTIERTFFREDFRRAYLSEIGLIDYANNAIQNYREGFSQHIDAERVRNAHYKIVIDYTYGLAADTLADILTDLDVNVVPLNARQDESRLALLKDRFSLNLQEVAKIVTALNADMGIQLDVGGEQLFIVDEKGEILDDITAALLMTELMLHAHPGSTVAVPATMPRAFETIASWHGGQLLRTQNNVQALIETESEILLAIDGTGNFLFPKFQPAVDGMMATVCLMDCLALRQMSISEVVAYLPQVHMSQGSIECDWQHKAKVMRLLNERHGGQRIEKMDGVKIYLSDEEWIHIAPNPDRPSFETIAEAKSTDRAHEIIEQYHEKIHAFTN